MAYLHARREKLGGYLPARNAKVEPLRHARGRRVREVRAGGRGQGDVQHGRLRAHDRRAPAGPRARQTHRPDHRRRGAHVRHGRPLPPDRHLLAHRPALPAEDQAQLSYYKEAVEGQILEEGINEAGAIASWVAAATSHAAHGVAMLPMYIYYSMFGFQRVGDAIWAAADSRSRGFLLGATAGRTTLSGEGLQHQDGSSHLVASTIPNCRAYDPCFAYELAVILEDGMRKMLTSSRTSSTT
jgi:pyruvate dehydrogenase E1 component